ncbi:hypothetical protein [Chitinimonas naiadis]
MDISKFGKTIDLGPFKGEILCKTGHQGRFLIEVSLYKNGTQIIQPVRDEDNTYASKEAAYEAGEQLLKALVAGLNQ